jgi:RHS repeat-associated protein
MTPPLACPLSAASAYPSISPGKERDTESGNDYFFARYYSSTMGRFLSPDWAAKATPVPYAKMDDPQTLNLYGYLRNNPLGGVDADGHCGGGPNDPPCNKVTVTVTPEKQPVTVDTRTQTFTSKGTGKTQTVTTTGPSGELHMVVKVSGTPTDGVKVSETNQTTVTTPAGNNTNSPKVENDTVTQNGGKYDDTVGAGYTPQQATAKEAQAAFSLPTSIVNTNTVTLQIPGVGDQSGFTCQATSTRTITNMPDGADYPTGYTLTTTQPVVTNPQ